jgi:hypothetical protein
MGVDGRRELSVGLVCEVAENREVGGLTGDCFWQGDVGLNVGARPVQRCSCLGDDFDRPAPTARILSGADSPCLELSTLAPAQ